MLYNLNAGNIINNKERREGRERKHKNDGASVSAKDVVWPFACARSHYYVQRHNHMLN